MSAIARHFLLLTATPHNGKEQDFQLFLSLIDPDRFGYSWRNAPRADLSGVMRRLVKEELLKFNGGKLFLERDAIPLNYALSPLEAQLYEAVTSYVQSEFNRADRQDNKIRLNMGFALAVLQRRLDSSPEAIYQSLRRRRERDKSCPESSIVNSIDIALEHSALLELQREHGLTEESMTSGIVAAMREDMERL